MQVDFYLLNVSETREGEHFVCRLTEKVFRQKHFIYIHTDNQSATSRLDDLLWTFSPGSFLPHVLAHHMTKDDKVKITLGYADIPATAHDVLINMATHVPLAHTQFSRIAEIVYNTEPHKQLSRKRYRYYREQKYAVSSHEMTI
ncbi:MAG: DNA polymerase III subunit chi [Gammaproteobacteria bacterium]|nr:DNA polymerase III subunit chi [Gammaproteobacteria bacterium]